MKKLTIGLCATALLLLTSCFGGKLASQQGGEVTGSGGKAFSEPAPYGMVLVKRGHLRMGIENQDSCGARRLLFVISRLTVSGWTIPRLQTRSTSSL